MSGIPSFSLYYLVQVGADNNRRTGVRATHEQQQHAAQRSLTHTCWQAMLAYTGRSHAGKSPRTPRRDHAGKLFILLYCGSPRALLDGTYLSRKREGQRGVYASQ